VLSPQAKRSCTPNVALSPHLCTRKRRIASGLSREEVLVLGAVLMRVGFVLFLREGFVLTPQAKIEG